MAESARLSGEGELGKMKHEQAAENPQDSRSLLYHLSPAIPATKTERGWEMDFGYCLARG